MSDRRLDAAHRAARQLRRETPRHLAVVACSYDTAHEPVEAQVTTKVSQLRETFPEGGPVSWSLHLVDDVPDTVGFSLAVRRAYASLDTGGLHLHALAERTPGGGRKGSAVLHGMSEALDDPSVDVVAYVNLNLKVHAAFLAPGLRTLAGGCEAAIGTRAPEDGGAAVGVGVLGRLKSRLFHVAAGAILPSLRAYGDTNAPMKLFTRRAAQLLVDQARNPNVTLDCEWLALLHRSQVEVRSFPVLWTQRPGSRPPWHLVPQSLADLWRLRRQGLD